MPEEKTGQARLHDALTTTGTAFTRAERCKMGLLGLLPTAEKTQQAEHCWHEFSTFREDPPIGARAGSSPSTSPKSLKLFRANRFGAVEELMMHRHAN